MKTHCLALIMAATITAALACMHVQGQTPPERDVPNLGGALASAMVEAAKNGYLAQLEVLETQPKTTAVDLDLIYRWSYRWMEAAYEAASGDGAKRRALTEHVDRMQQLHDVIQRRTNFDLESQFPAFTRYYAEEARHLQATR